MRRFVLTGAPGSGKTSIIRALAANGHSVVEEAATAEIAEYHAEGVDEPWRESGFIDRIAVRQERSLGNARGDLLFFDRSPICTHALAVHLGLPVPEGLQRVLDRIAAERPFVNRVFFVENLGFIEPTAARRITYEDSLQFERIHEESYRAFGYHLVRVPAASVEERARFVLGQVG